MMTVLRDYLITFGTFIAVDLIWLVFIAKNLYQKHLGYIMATKVNWTAALLFYAIFIAGMLFFVINPALSKQSLQYAFLAGAFFGLVTYATYDLTNLATLKDWPLIITIIDLAWGTTVSALTCSLSYFIISRLS